MAASTVDGHDCVLPGGDNAEYTDPRTRLRPSCFYEARPAGCAEEKRMIVLDCLGEICPIPLLRLQKALKGGGAKEILLITDHSCVPVFVGDFCRAKKLKYTADEVINGVWELHITSQGG